MPEVNCAKNANLLGSFSIYEQPKWERIVASTQVGFRVSIWVRIRVWIRVRDRVRVRIRVRVRVRVRLGLYFGCSYIEKGPFVAPKNKKKTDLAADFKLVVPQIARVIT